ncbi:MAG: hypothetical protein GX256_00425 [Fretibacterium sp.]|nr:hypothetical protein [Fretibacterium sp.]
MEKTGIGSYIASIYGGYERIFKICLEDEGVRVPKSERWHADLLFYAIQKEIVPAALIHTLKGMMSYRHRQVHGYGHSINTKILRESCKDVVETFPAFEEHIHTLIQKQA